MYISVPNSYLIKNNYSSQLLDFFRKIITKKIKSKQFKFLLENLLRSPAFCY